ncbi:MAG: hypothetical protein WC819_02220 [Parcubacteria group bacterium]|jgi:hypothetical protein
MKREKTLHEMIEEIFDAKEKKIPSSLLYTLRSCSEELEKTSNEEEFDAVMTNYSLLDDRLKSAGLLISDFRDVTTKLKKEYFR